MSPRCGSSHRSPSGRSERFGAAYGNTRAERARPSGPAAGLWRHGEGSFSRRRHVLLEDLGRVRGRVRVRVRDRVRVRVRVRVGLGIGVGVGVGVGVGIEIGLGISVKER